MSAKESSRTWGQRRGRHRVALEGAVVHGEGAGGRPRAASPPFLPTRTPQPALRLSLPFHPTPERLSPHLSPCPPFYPSLHPPPPAPPRWFLAPRSFLGQGRGGSGPGAPRTAMQVPVCAALLLDCTTRAWSFFSCSRRDLGTGRTPQHPAAPGFTPQPPHPAPSCPPFQPWGHLRVLLLQVQDFPLQLLVLGCARRHPGGQGERREVGGHRWQPPPAGCGVSGPYRLSSPSMYSFFFLRLSCADCLFLIFRRIFFSTRSSYWGHRAGGEGSRGQEDPHNPCAPRGAASASQAPQDPPW